MRPVLVAPDLDKEFRMETDTSNYATRGVLSMKCSDELQRLVAFISKLLNDTERNYEIHNKEMLAIVRCLEAQRHFLEGASTKFEIWTDHKNLEYFMKVQKLNQRQARWVLYLSRFDFMLKHILGSKMGKADSLSRRSDWEVGVERDNKDKTLVKQLEVRRTKKVKVIVDRVDLLEKVQQSKVKDDEVVKTVEEMKQARIKVLRDKEQREEDDIIYKEGKVYVPKDDTLRAKIIRLHYDMPVGRHRGQQKTVEIVTQNFWWPEVMKEVKQYIEGYDVCQQNKNCTKQPAGKLMPNSFPKKPWTHISADFITKLPLAQGYDSILVVVDWLTKMVHFIPTTEKIMAERLVRLFRDNMQKLHGLSKSIISDQEPQFAAGIMQELNRMLGIKSKLLIVFHS